MNFYGYKRPDGRVGVRNKVLILPASVCASDTTRIISQQVVGSVTFNNQLGCSQVAPDQQFTMDVMAGYAANPNVYGTVVVSLGCENCQMDLVVKAIQERTNKPLKQVIIQEAGGTVIGVGFDKSDTILGLIKNGFLLCTMAQNPDVMGREGVKVAVKALSGETIDQTNVDTGVSVLNKDTI